MSSRRLCIGVVVLLSAAALEAQSSLPTSRSDLLSRAIESNRDLLAVRQRMDEARGLLRQAGVRPAPTLDVAGTTGRPLGTMGEEQFSAGISKEIETAGKRSKREEVARKQLTLAEAEYDERVRQLRYEILVRYADSVLFAQRRKVLNRLIDANRQALDLTKARVAKGDAAALEANLIAAELGRLSAQHSVASGELEAARADLSRLAGLDAGDRLVAADAAMMPGDSLDLAALCRKALELRPDLRILNAAQEQGDAELRLAEAQAKPNVTVSAGYGRVYSRFDDQLGLTPEGVPAGLRDRDDTLSLGVSIPLFSRRQNLGNVEASLARMRAAKLRKEYLAQAIPLEVEAAYRRFTASRAAHRMLEREAIGLAERNLDVIRQAYSLGQLRLLDVLAEQRRVLDMQLAGIEMQTEMEKGLAELERAVGGPIQ